MHPEQLSQHAKVAAEHAEAGDDRWLKGHLASLTPQDRLAVAKEMELLNQRHRAADDSIPIVQITVGTNADGSQFLQSVSERETRASWNPQRWFGDTHDAAKELYKANECPADYAESNGVNVHMECDPVTGVRTKMDLTHPAEKHHLEFDPTTALATFREITTNDGSHHERTTFDKNTQWPLISDIETAQGKTHLELNPPNGAQPFGDYVGKDGSKAHYVFDAQTRRLISADSVTAGGTIVHVEFDANTGLQKTAFQKLADGTTSHIECDEKGVPKFKDTRYPNGSFSHAEYDANTAEIKSVRTNYIDGSKGFTVCDPDTGMRKFEDIQNKDGSQVHDVYDTFTGRRISSESKDKMGVVKARSEFDPESGRLTTMDVFNKNGTTEHHVYGYDPITGKQTYHFKDVRKPK